MQTREIKLTELDTAYNLVQLLRPQLTYDTFEDTVYAMRHQEYKMYGLFDGDRLISFSGISVQVSLDLGRYLYVYELISDPALLDRDYDHEMLIYLQDLKRLLQCERIVFAPHSYLDEKQFMLEREGFSKELVVLTTS